MKILELGRPPDPPGAPPADVGRPVELAGQAGFFNFCPADAWRPAVNLYESASSFFVCVDLAGMARPEIRVTVESGVLVIRGMREHPRPDEQCGELSIHLMEIDQGAFCRSVEIPAQVDQDNIRATYKSCGFLWIELPKKATP